MIQIAERIEESAQKMKWTTIVEVAKVLPDDAPKTQAECTAAVDAVRAICCLARTGCICFDLDGNLIEDWSGNTTRTRNRMQEDYEGRWKRKAKDAEEEIARLSHSLSSSVHAGISDSCSVEEMTSQKHHNWVRNPSGVLMLIGQVRGRLRCSIIEACHEVCKVDKRTRRNDEAFRKGNK